jgi:phage shock protein A
MGLMKRFSMIFKAKASKQLDKYEDPRETLDYSYQRQIELLQKMRRGVADVATSRKRVELQAQTLQQSAAKLENQARQAITQNRDDLAREALTRRATIATQLQDLQVQHDQLKGEEAKLVDASQRLQAKVEAFRTRKETIKATYTAAEAQTRINEAVSGIGEEMGDVGLAMQRAEDKVAQMQSRAGALDELMASGALDNLSQTSDRLEAELNRTSSDVMVEAELTRIRGELGGPRTAKQLGAPEEKADTTPAGERQQAEEAQSAPAQEDQR